MASLPDHQREKVIAKFHMLNREKKLTTYKLVWEERREPKLAAPSLFATLRLCTTQHLLDFVQFLYTPEGQEVAPLIESLQIYGQCDTVRMKQAQWVYIITRLKNVEEVSLHNVVWWKPPPEDYQWESLRGSYVPERHLRRLSIDRICRDVAKESYVGHTELLVSFSEDDYNSLVCFCKHIDEVVVTVTPPSSGACVSSKDNKARRGKAKEMPWLSITGSKTEAGQIVRLSYHAEEKQSTGTITAETGHPDDSRAREHLHLSSCTTLIRLEFNIHICLSPDDSATSTSDFDRMLEILAPLSAETNPKLCNITTRFTMDARSAARRDTVFQHFQCLPWQRLQWLLIKNFAWTRLALSLVMAAEPSLADRMFDFASGQLSVLGQCEIALLRPTAGSSSV